VGPLSHSMKELTPYQHKILERAEKAAKSREGKWPVTRTLLEAIESRDILLEEFREFFGPHRGDTHKINTVLDTP